MSVSYPGFKKSSVSEGFEADFMSLEQFLRVDESKVNDLETYNKMKMEALRSLLESKKKMSISNRRNEHSK
jgi:hypothetical protein